MAIFAHFTDEELVENLAEATIPQADLKQEWVGFGLAQGSSPRPESSITTCHLWTNLAHTSSVWAKNLG